MKYNLRFRQSLSNKAKIALTVGGVSIMAIAVYFSISINTLNVQDSLAGHRNLLANDPINNGEIILAYTWDQNPSNKPDIGPDASSISINAECLEGGVDSTFGLSAGNTMKDINLQISPSSDLNSDGIDFSIDFRRMETSGNFISRGSSFNFGMKEGKLIIRYKLTAQNGKSYLVDQITNYEIPEDLIFRNYRFIYSPNSGKGEILVNNATVWTNTGAEKSILTWKNDEAFIIGQGINGSGKAIPVFDNMLIRKTETTNKAPLELLSFSAEYNSAKVIITWNTAIENGTEYFTLEKSNDTKSFTEIGRIKAAGKSDMLKEYRMTDAAISPGIFYYRLGLSNSNLKSVWMPVIAFRIKPEMITSSPAINVSSELETLIK